MQLDVTLDIYIHVAHLLISLFFLLNTLVGHLWHGLWNSKGQRWCWNNFILWFFFVIISTCFHLLGHVIEHYVWTHEQDHEHSFDKFNIWARF